MRTRCIQRRSTSGTQTGNKRKRIHCSKGKKALYTFTFPFFVFSFGLAMLVALFGDVTWKPIHHSVALSIGDLGGASSQELPKNRKL